MYIGYRSCLNVWIRDVNGHHKKMCLWTLDAVMYTTWCLRLHLLLQETYFCQSAHTLQEPLVGCTDDPHYWILPSLHFVIPEPFHLWRQYPSRTRNDGLYCL